MLAPTFRSQAPLLLFLSGSVLTVLPALAACGAETAFESSTQELGATFEQAGPSDRVFTYDDFSAVGFKKSKQYSVEGLTGATEAWFGWWQPPGSELADYEVRLYRSHEDAVEFGIPFAEEASGENAIVNSAGAMWKEDVKDRRAVIGATGTVSNGVGAKYGDYAIYGNAVLLCEGANVEHSLGRCASLMAAVLADGR